MTKDKYISNVEAMQLLAIGFDMKKWEGATTSEIIPGTTRQEWCKEELVMKAVSDAILLPHLRIDQAAKWLREELGIDLVVSPRFDSTTAERKGYFCRWSQRTDVNMDKATYRTYDIALANGIGQVLLCYPLRSNERSEPQS